MNRRAAEPKESAGAARAPSRSAWRAAAVLSLAAHAGLAALAVRSTATATTADAGVGRVYPLPDPEGALVVELPPMSLSVPPDAPAPPPPSAGGAATARTDDGHAGAGGDLTVTAKARNLAPRPEERTTVDTWRDAVADEQENRLRTARHRASHVDLRLALEPMELTFVASGRGFRFERHPVALLDGALGAPGAKGSNAGTVALGQSPGQGSLLGAQALGGVPAPKGGAAFGKAVIGAPQIVGAAVVKARPHVNKGKPSVTADGKGTPADDVDSDQAVALALKSIVSNSTAGGAVLGEGKGGSGGGGEAGSGGAAGPGSSATALGAGGGSSSSALARTDWFRRLGGVLGPMLAGAFPSERERELRNGTVIVDLIVAKAGRVVEVIVVRPSGFEEFDQAVVTRLRGSDRLPPVPDLLSQGPLTVRVPVTGGWQLP